MMICSRTRIAMNATLDNSHFSPSLLAASTQPSTKPLWAAVGVLSICVMAMGATLVHVNKRPEPLALASIPVASSYAMNAPAGMLTSDKYTEKTNLAATPSAQSAPKVVAKQSAGAVATTPSTRAASPVTAPVTTPAVIAQAPTAPAPVCKSCGTIEAVSPITKTPPGSGVGVIAGGVLGGVVGNQIGKGNGRAATTVLGAIGGGWAGNAIEKNMKKTTAYSVRIRMADGSVRTLEQSSAPLIGAKVTLDGNTMRPA